MFIKSDLVVFDQLYANIFRSLLPPDDLSKKNNVFRKITKTKNRLTTETS